MRWQLNKLGHYILLLLMVVVWMPVVHADTPERSDPKQQVLMPKSGGRLLDLSHLNAVRQTEDLVESNFFSTTSLFPPVLVEEKSSVPTAPQLPFIFLGKITQDGVVTLFLAIENRRLNVRLHDVLEGGSYRLKSIGDDRLIFTYLPLKVDQELGLPNVRLR